MFDDLTPDQRALVRRGLALLRDELFADDHTHHGECGSVRADIDGVTELLHALGS